MICATAAECETGTLDESINYCKLDGSDICPSGYTINSTTSRCEAPPSCTAPGTYSSTMDLCTDQASYDCPTGYTYVSGVCYRLPDCPNGTYNESAKSCYEGLNTCTLGDYSCYTYEGERLCSPYTCVDQNNPTVTDTAQSDLTSPEDDGEIDEEGDCEGQFYILSGMASECRTSGTQTLFKNCCNSATAMNPLYCDAETDGATAQMVAEEMCHYVGSYCTEKWLGISCVQSKKVYCCFNSKLARIINEQARSQLQNFQPDEWGTPEDPDCRGFTPEEFQMLDFSKIDLTEFFDDIKSNLTLSEDVEKEAEDKIYDYYQNLQ
ncbi:MAG: conjugal transfer protein TraN [Deltaproteobacteria bacterium]|nr:conjugal transfer protein TraN [Deltaproteobacteria bacterium]